MSYIFVITCPQAHHLQSKKFNFLLKFCLKILFCRHYFSPVNTLWEFQSGQHIMRKGKDPDPDPHLWLMVPDPEGPKHADPVLPSRSTPNIDIRHLQSTYSLSNRTDYIGVITMERLDQGHLHPKLEDPRLTSRGRESDLDLCCSGSEHSSKELFEQHINSYLEHTYLLGYLVYGVEDPR